MSKTRLDTSTISDLRVRTRAQCAEVLQMRVDSIDDVPDERQLLLGFVASCKTSIRVDAAADSDVAIALKLIDAIGLTDMARQRGPIENLHPVYITSLALGGSAAKMSDHKFHRTTSKKEQH